MRKQYYNKTEIQKCTNNKYYDVCYFFCCKTPIYLSILSYLATNCELSGEINVEMWIIENSKKTQSEKTVSWFSLIPLKNVKNCSWRNSMN